MCQGYWLAASARSFTRRFASLSQNPECVKPRSDAQIVSIQVWGFLFLWLFELPALSPSTNAPPQSPAAAPLSSRNLPQPNALSPGRGCLLERATPAALPGLGTSLSVKEGRDEACTEGRPSLPPWVPLASPNTLSALAPNNLAAHLLSGAQTYAGTSLLQPLPHSPEGLPAGLEFAQVWVA